MPKPVVTPRQDLDGASLALMFSAAADYLAGQTESINALNVFPVPDGDTGTNMLLTLRSALDEVDTAAMPDASQVAAAMAKGALMGARGNSGVILSQILRGMSDGFAGKSKVTGRDLPTALTGASEAAYAVVANPVEGTILTVIREAAAAAQSQRLEGDPSFAEVLEVALEAANAAVARTPFQLDVLRENGVVDAGGQGLAVILKGALAWLNGERPSLGDAEPSSAGTPLPAWRNVSSAKTFGFCSEYLLEGCSAELEELRGFLTHMGDSVLVASIDGLTKVHLHTATPERVEERLAGYGSIREAKVEDIDAQHRAYLANVGSGSEARLAVVAVAAGDGLAAVFRSLGAEAIVSGGQTVNPSAEEIVAAVAQVGARQVIVLPNNPNVVGTARQAERLVAESAMGKEAFVLSTTDMPQGVAALMSFNYEAGLDVNLEAMGGAVGRVKTGEVTRAVRDAHVDGIDVCEGQAMGLVGGRLVLVGDGVRETTVELAEHLGVEDGSIVTLYYGQDVSDGEAEETAQVFRARFPEAEVQPVTGGQPHYPYLLSIE